MNILTFTKEIINICKLDQDVRSQYSEIYNYLSVKGDHIDLHFNVNLSQQQINDISYLVNNFVEISVLEEEKNILIKKQSEGHELYQKMIAQINIDGFASNPLDSGILVYQQLFVIRNMLKDGFFEYALRYIVKTIAPMGIFTQTQLDLFKLWIRTLANKYGTPTAILDAIEQAENI